MNLQTAINSKLAIKGELAIKCELAIKAVNTYNVWNFPFSYSNSYLLNICLVDTKKIATFLKLLKISVVVKHFQ